MICCFILRDQNQPLIKRKKKGIQQDQKSNASLFSAQHSGNQNTENTHSHTHTFEGTLLCDIRVHSSRTH